MVDINVELIKWSWNVRLSWVICRGMNSKNTAEQKCWIRFIIHDPLTHTHQEGIDNIHFTEAWGKALVRGRPVSLRHSLIVVLVAQRIKCLPAMQEIQVWSLGWEDPLEKEMATHSSILAWRIQWTEEPGGLESTGSQRVGHDWATSLITNAG